MSFYYGQFCPIAKAAEILGERWTILILRELLLGPCRYSDFNRSLSRISPTLLTKRLGQLVDWGLVTREIQPGSLRYEYHLTAAGHELRPLIVGLGAWGMKWARGQMRDDELDVHLLMHDYCRLIDASKLPEGGTIISFVFSHLTKFARWWIVIEPDRTRELCVDNPGRPVDITIRTDARTMTEIWAGDTDIRAARKEGRLQLSGNPLLIRTLSSWLRNGLLAHIRPAAEPLRV